MSCCCAGCGGCAYFVVGSSGIWSPVTSCVSKPFNDHHVPRKLRCARPTPHRNKSVSARLSGQRRQRRRDVNSRNLEIAMAKEPKTLDDLFHDTLKDIYFAEKKILATLPKMAKAT